MSNVTITVPGVGPITLNLPNGPLPVIDPLTGNAWTSSGAGFEGRLARPQPATYDSNFTKPQSSPIKFLNPA